MAQETSIQSYLPKMIYGLILGILVFAVFLFFSDAEEMIETVSNMPKQHLVWAFVLTLFSYSLRLWKWHFFTVRSGFPIKFRDNIVIFFIGLMMSITPGKAGEFLKSYFMKEKGNVAYSQSVPVVFYDRLTDLLAMMVLIGIGFLAYPFGIAPLLLLLGGLVIFFVIVSVRPWMEGLIRLITKPRKLRRFREPLQNFYEQTLFLLKLPNLSFALVVSVAAWFMECVALFVVLQAFSLDLSLVASVSTFSLGTLAGALSMIPGGLGAAEGSMTGLLIYFGVSNQMAVTISLVIRFVTLWFGVFLGLAIFAWNRKSFMNGKGR